MTRIGVASSQAETYVAELDVRGIVAEPVDSSTRRRPEVLLADPASLRDLGPLLDTAWVQSTWAGVDAIDWSLVPDDTTVTGLPDMFGDQMREYVFGHLLAYTQRTHRRPTSWEHSPPRALAGARIGILGAGSIGRALAITARHLGMVVAGCSRSGRLDQRFDEMYPVEAVAEFAGRLDHLVVVLPATGATRGLVDARLLDSLTPGATLTNVGRGSTVVVDDVVSAIRSGTLSRAVLDVTDPEPLPGDHPAWGEENIVITGHTAAVSHPDEVVGRFVDNLMRFERDEPLIGVIDRDRGY